jgi:SAM-dependent methyltransferase
MTPSHPPGAREAYDVLAPAYDLLTAGYAYDRWLSAVESLAAAHGLRGRRVLDVACGTGHSFLPLLDRGYEVTACDISPAMARRAREKAAGRARVEVADMRRLPALGEFDLITCLDDAINHLLAGPEVVQALAGMRANLAAGGLIVFDVNTVAAYRQAADVVADDPRNLVAWRGSRARISGPGQLAEILVEVFHREGERLWARERSVQRERHYPLGEMEALVREAGLRVLATAGQNPGGRLDAAAPDEARHPKVLFVAADARHGDPNGRRAP